MLDAVVRHSLAILDGERGFLVLQRAEGLDYKVIRNWRRDEYRRVLTQAVLWTLKLEPPVDGVDVAIDASMFALPPRASQPAKP